MAITITTRAGFEHDTYDRFCAGHLVELQYDVNFGADITNNLININFWLWGRQVNILNNTPPLLKLSANPAIGYNFISPGVVGFTTLALAGSTVGKETWDNVEVAIRILTTSTGIIRIRFMHTVNQLWWIQQVNPQANFKRPFHSHRNELLEYTIRPQSMYDRPFGDNYLGLHIQRYQVDAGDFLWDPIEEKTYAEYRNFAWWWNQLNTDPLDVTDTPVLSYQWAFSRNSIPVATLSLTEDTDVLFRVTVVPDMVFLDEYCVALIKIDPIADNVDEFWKELPMAEGEVTAVNTFEAAKLWFPHELNGVEIVGDCAMFAETAPGSDIWECEFTIPKEVIDIGCTYRLGIILKHEFTGPPL